MFNCYKHWVQLLLRHLGDPPFTLMIKEGVTRGDPNLMVIYGIILVLLEEDLQEAELGVLSPFYLDYATFDAPTRRSAQLLKMSMKRGPDQGYFPEPAKSLFIYYTPDQDVAEGLGITT